MGSDAEKAYLPEQLNMIRGYGYKIIVASVPTIQAYGGGGVRCMMA